MFINDKRFSWLVILLAVIILLALLESGRRRLRRTVTPVTIAPKKMKPLSPNASISSGQPGEPSAISEPNDVAVQAIRFLDDGRFPNNKTLPLLIYKRVLPVGEDGSVPTECIDAMIEAHQWGNAWANGIYTYHHYHSTAHEVLFICRGKVTVQFGGPQGEPHVVRAGDVVIIPAGVAHKNLQADRHLSVIGAYPEGQVYDMCYGKVHERPQVDRNIDSVALPIQDPVYGSQGPLHRYWVQGKHGCDNTRPAPVTAQPRSDP
jgi:uncharacterized protein YjlB